MTLRDGYTIGKSLGVFGGGVFAHGWSYALGHSIDGSCAVGMVGVGGPALAPGRRDAHRSGLLSDTLIPVPKLSFSADQGKRHAEIKASLHYSIT